eukprot:8404754-Alexandrium_andersonii.AAC.1
MLLVVVAWMSHTCSALVRCSGGVRKRCPPMVPRRLQDSGRRGPEVPLLRVQFEALEGGKAAGGAHVDLVDVSFRHDDVSLLRRPRWRSPRFPVRLSCGWRG